MAAGSQAGVPIPIYVAGSELTPLEEALQEQDGKLESQGSGEWEGWGQKSFLFPPRTSSVPAPRRSIAAGWTAEQGQLNFSHINIEGVECPPPVRGAVGLRW